MITKETQAKRAIAKLIGVDSKLKLDSKVIFAVLQHIDSRVVVENGLKFINVLLEHHCTAHCPPVVGPQPMG